MSSTDLIRLARLCLDLTDRANVRPSCFKLGISTTCTSNTTWTVDKVEIDVSMTNTETIALMTPRSWLAQTGTSGITVAISQAANTIQFCDRCHKNKMKALVGTGRPGPMPASARTASVSWCSLCRKEELRRTSRSPYEETLIADAKRKKAQIERVGPLNSFTCMLKKLAAKDNGMKKKAVERVSIPSLSQTGKRDLVYEPNSVNLVTLSASAMPLLLSNIETEATKAWNDCRSRFCVVAIFVIIVGNSFSALSGVYTEGD